MKPKILVTGGTGYIGSHTVVELQNAGFAVVVVDNLSNSNVEVLDGIKEITGEKPSFYQIDCLDNEKLYQVFEKEKNIEGVIHFAASKAVNESVQKPLLYYKNNVLSLLNLLELMSEFSVKNIVFSSSCTVYGQPEVLPVTEKSPIQEATSPYGNTKQICEEIIRDTAKASNALNAILLRYFNPIGAHPSALIGELPNGVPQNLLPYLVQTAVGIRKELSVFGDDYSTPDGSCIRDYIYVVDLAKAHVAALNRMLHAQRDTNVECFNVGTGNGVSVLELINKFKMATGVDVPYKIAKRREGDIEQIWADTSYANKMLNWSADTPMEEVLLSAWKWELHLKKQKNRNNA